MRLHDLRDAVTIKDKKGNTLLSKEDADVSKLMATMVADAHARLAVNAIIKYGRNEGYIVPVKTKGEQYDGWISAKFLPGSSKLMGVENMKVHPMFFNGMKELAGAEIC